MHKPLIFFAFITSISLVSMSAFASGKSCNLKEVCDIPGPNGGISYVKLEEKWGKTKKYHCTIKSNNSAEKIQAYVYPGKSVAFMPQSVKASANGEIISISAIFSGKEGQIKVKKEWGSDGTMVCND